MPRRLFRIVRPAAAPALALAAMHAVAQAPAEPSAAAASAVQRVDITGGRQTDADQRRQSSAAKIVVGRDEIERLGESTTSELLKRLPGISVQGSPGRGGNVRMRGLGGGYTQILVDGERMPQGYSIDSIPPDQIERIEILRAPTAETGAQAIAGTINVVLREGARRQQDEVQVATRVDQGRVAPSASWTRSRGGSQGLSYNFATSVWTRNDRSASATRTTDVDPATGAVTLDQRTTSASVDQRHGFNASGRLQWRDERDTFSLTPMLNSWQGDSTGTGTFSLLAGAPKDALYDHVATASSSRFTLGRLGGQWTRRADDGGRFEARLSASESHWHNEALREEFDGADRPTRTLDDETNRRDHGTSAGLKLTQPAGEAHTLVAGAEAENDRRDERSTSVQNGSALLGAFGDNIEASSRRRAAYVQDEWNVSSRLATMAGLRWEGTRTRGVASDGTPVARSSEVLTPLAHAVWRLDDQRRDQVRLALTRSYRPPTLGNLVGRPSINSRYPAPGPNTPTNADRVGNPDLLPEIATGIDLAFERYLPAGGSLSASLFERRIRDLIRNLTQLETVGWADVPRYVSRPQNVGDATTQGIELDAKFRLSDAWADAPRIDIRANASFYRSRVDSVPGPDNRVDQQPGQTANLGADYRFAAVPLAIGANLNWTPGYETRLADTQSAYQGRKFVVDAYAAWTVRPGLLVRLSANNLTAQDVDTAGSLDGETSQTTAVSTVNWGLRVEMKL